MPTGVIIALGAFAGLTIFLGLPVAMFKRVSTPVRTFLSMLATGVLIFLLYDIISKASEPIGDALTLVREHHTNQATFFGDVALLIVGLGLGLVGLVYFNNYVITRYRASQTRNRPSRSLGGNPAPAPSVAETRLALAGIAPAAIAGNPVRSSAPSASVSSAGTIAEVASSERELTPKMLAIVIAVGIGLHNFSEGLAIGQSAASGALQLAAVLIIGFGLHNMSEGFGIAGPLSGQSVSWKLLLLLGVVGGGPTFLGTVIGVVFHSPQLFIFCLALAAGAIIYVIAELLGVAKRFKAQNIVMWGLLAGFVLGYLTDLIVSFAGA